MATPVNLEKYQILISPDSNKVQGLQMGDIVRRQYFDGANTIYSLMCVLETGTVKKQILEAKRDSLGQPILDSNGSVITENVEKDVPYFIGALLDGMPPQSGELLDFARITSLFNIDRSGALYLTASDSKAPYMDVIDGLGRNKSLSWPEGISTADFEDASVQYVVRGNASSQSYVHIGESENRILKVTKTTSRNTNYCGLSQEFYELIASQKKVLISYKIRANKSFDLNAALKYANDVECDAEWTESVNTNWQYKFQAVSVINSGRHLRKFILDFAPLRIGDWVEIADFNIILLDDIANFGDASVARMGKLEGVSDPVFGTLSGYGAYVQKLYASQTTHISGTLTAGDENGFASTFYAGKIHKNCFRNSCDIDFLSPVAIDVDNVINPTGIGNVYCLSSSFVMRAQDRTWMSSHSNQRYCFSFWCHALKPCTLVIKQNDKAVGVLEITSNETHEWRRLNISFPISLPAATDQDLKLAVGLAFASSIYDSEETENGVLYFTAPQLEKGTSCTQYQPTDDVLDETEDYGAWFARGGIGGTIQNPLLRLNYDGTGAIDTRTNSFRLNQDGSGYLANQNIRWDKEGKVTFGSGVTLDWDSFDSETKTAICSKYIKITGEDTFVGMQVVDKTMAYSPNYIRLQLNEVGITGSGIVRRWFYVVDSQDIPLYSHPSNDTTQVLIYPEDVYWDTTGDTLQIKAEVEFKGEKYCDTITLKKLVIQGYKVVITSSNGTVFKNGHIETSLKANVTYNNTPLDDDIAVEMFDFKWHKYLQTDIQNEVTDEWATLEERASQCINIVSDNNIGEVYTCDIAPKFPGGCPYDFPIVFGDQSNQLLTELPILTEKDDSSFPIVFSSES